ncbi:HIT family protein [Candidatus Mycoplasma haematohominis]|uniref:HIT family protein n=1 Tax=Candidatus Mycoplasma haematohominis TaxID=1494318 RepID=UPI001C0A744F|nr:HIT domain-containing protein [Candidatus Mycoplasma haemohominis]
MPEDCIFCKIAAETPNNFVAESEKAFAILDIKPITKGHTLVIPKKHFANLSVTDDDYLKDVIVLAKQVAKQLKEMYPDIKGFNYISNQGKEAKQVIFHLHLHVIPKY